MKWFLLWLTRIGENRADNFFMISSKIKMNVLFCVFFRYVWFYLLLNINLKVSNKVNSFDVVWFLYSSVCYFQNKIKTYEPNTYLLMKRHNLSEVVIFPPFICTLCTSLWLSSLQGMVLLLRDISKNVMFLLK